MNNYGWKRPEECRPPTHEVELFLYDGESIVIGYYVNIKGEHGFYNNDYNFKDITHWQIVEYPLPPV